MVLQSAYVIRKSHFPYVFRVTCMKVEWCYSLLTTLENHISLTSFASLAWRLNGVTVCLRHWKITFPLRLSRHLHEGRGYVIFAPNLHHLARPLKNIIFFLMRAWGGPCFFFLDRRTMLSSCKLQSVLVGHVKSRYLGSVTKSDPFYRLMGRYSVEPL